MSGCVRQHKLATTNRIRPRARVKLQRVNCNYSKPYPPDGQAKLWWERLMKALGTTSSAFVNATLVQIQNASRLPRGWDFGDECQCRSSPSSRARSRRTKLKWLWQSMACTHAVTMAVLASLGGAFGGNRNTAIAATAVAPLMKAFATQVEMLRRLKNGGLAVGFDRPRTDHRLTTETP